MWGGHSCPPPLTLLWKLLSPFQTVHCRYQRSTSTAADKSVRPTRQNAFTGEKPMALRVGDEAPDFDLPAIEDGRQVRVRLSDFRGRKNVVVTFHPLNWTPT